MSQKGAHPMYITIHIQLAMVAYDLVCYTVYTAVMHVINVTI